MPRPRIEPTEAQRRMVKSMAAVGTPHEDIARRLGLRSPKTLRKYFRKELDLGKFEANFNVRRTLYEMAISGKHPACTIFWDKTRNRAPEVSSEHRSGALVPFIVALDKDAA